MVKLLGGTVFISSPVVCILSEGILYWIDPNEKKGIINNKFQEGDIVVITLDATNIMKPIVMNVTPWTEGTQLDS
jgi:hypothetical protein